MIDFRSVNAVPRRFHRQRLQPQIERKGEAEEARESERANERTFVKLSENCANVTLLLSVN